MPFCPAKVKPIQNRVILVEGIFDALNLWDKGLKNTVCCFGTQQVSWVKSKSTQTSRSFWNRYYV